MVWLGYASIVLSIVWGVPGLVCGMQVLRMARLQPTGDSIDPRERRDLKGAVLLARIGIVLSGIVILLIVWSWISTWIAFS